jgi:hypothetical protein
VTGILRLIGLLNAAVWFGAAFFFLFGASPAANSRDMQQLLGARNFPFYSVAIDQLLAVHYYHLFLACSLVAILHLAAEWLYLGRRPTRMTLGLLTALLLMGTVELSVVQPRLRAAHRLQYTRADLRQAAGRDFRIWHGVSQTIQVCLVGGLAVYLWRVGTPDNSARFVNAGKFHS